MAWIDDRLWCHPKVIGLTSGAKAAYVMGIAYSSGMSTGGVLQPAMQKAIGANTRIRGELVAAGLWDVNGDGASVHIHDWKEHNSKRDERKKRDRDRKRAMRSSK